MALKNRDEKEANQLHGVDMFNDPIDVTFGTFTYLQNWVPGGIYQLRKKRGVDPVASGAMLPIGPCETFVSTDALFCGTEPVLCGLQQVFAIVASSGVITCNNDPLVALNNSEITC